MQQADLFGYDKLGEHTLVKKIMVKPFEKKQTKLNIHHPGRNPLPESLRREVIELLPKEDVANLKPIGKEVSQSQYLNVDETTIKVLDNDKKGITRQGYYRCVL